MSAQPIDWEAGTVAEPVQGALRIAGGAVRVVAEPSAPPAAVLLRRGRLSDVPELHALLNAYAEQGLLLPRTRKKIAATIDQYTVAVDVHGIAGCGALRLYGPDLAEVCALGVAERVQGQGIGRCLVEAIVEEAEARGVTRLFALTLQERFFNRLGFRTRPMAEMPEKLTVDCAACPRRNACNEILVLRELPAAH